MNFRKIRTGVLSALLGVLLTVTGTALYVGASGPGGQHDAWLDSWSAAQMSAADARAPNWSADGFAGHTIRQTVRPTLAGESVRITLSNLFGDRPLAITAATVANTAAGAAVRSGTVRPISFGGAPGAVIPRGAELTSDSIDYPVNARQSLTVTLYLSRPTGPATFHYLANTTTYRAIGDHSADIDGWAFTESSRSWYYLSGVEVSGTPNRDGVVAFGDSLTDGAGAWMDMDNRYPDVLADRLAVAGRPRAVLNTGIGGNRTVPDPTSAGQSAATRFRRDVLDKDGIGTVILVSGINDIGASELLEPWARPNPAVTADQLIAEYRLLIRMAHTDGLRIVGGTLPPYRGTPYFSERGEQVRDAVNSWIRGSGEFDAVVDFERVLADPSDPDVLAAPFDSGDHLHPDPAGYSAMADAAARVLIGKADQ
ncbi:SGNH/GDSL hydrolase family protein [Nocardia sp. NPDC019395]|uniref:SGNH/GDSL hydrolase family protein n=1 Tax=Nocardia sp. NPDC019395 TaxID=3154686 RepID=UPI0033FBFD84